MFFKLTMSPDEVQSIHKIVKSIKPDIGPIRYTTMKSNSFFVDIMMKNDENTGLELTLNLSEIGFSWLFRKVNPIILKGVTIKDLLYNIIEDGTPIIKQTIGTLHEEDALDKSSILNLPDRIDETRSIISDESYYKYFFDCINGDIFESEEDLEECYESDTPRILIAFPTKPDIRNLEGYRTFDRPIYFGGFHIYAKNSEINDTGVAVTLSNEDMHYLSSTYPHEYIKDMLAELSQILTK